MSEFLSGPTVGPTVLFGPSEPQFRLSSASVPEGVSRLNKIIYKIMKNEENKDNTIIEVEENDIGCLNEIFNKKSKYTIDSLRDAILYAANHQPGTGENYKETVEKFFDEYLVDEASLESFQHLLEEKTTYKYSNSSCIVSGGKRKSRKQRKSRRRKLRNSKKRTSYRK